MNKVASLQVLWGGGRGGGFRGGEGRGGEGGRGGSHLCMYIIMYLAKSQSELKKYAAPL